MEATEKTARLMRFVFSSPKSWETGVLIIVFSIVFGLIITTEKNLLNIIKYSILIFAFPAFLSGMLSKPLAESLGGLLYLRRSMLLSFICLLVIGFISILGFFFNRLPGALVFGYSSVIWLRHIVLLGTSNSKHIRSFPASVSQTLFGFTGFYFIFHNPETILWFLFTAVFFVSAVILVETAKIPMKKSFGFNGLELLKYALAHLTDGSLELEQFFEVNGEETDAEVGVISFRNKKGAIKAAVVVPGIHPGPFGRLGGSNLPSKIMEKFDYPVFVLHSASTHDLNPVNSEQCRKIAEAVRFCVKEADYVSGGSRFIKKSSKSEIFTQFFGNSLLIMHSPLKPTDDVDDETGKTTGLKTGGNAFFVDAHNCLEKGAKSVVFGSLVSKDIICLAENAVSSAKENMVNSMKIGVSSKKVLSDDVGETGVMVLVTEANSQRTAYVLWDGNNMLKGVREDIAEKLGDIVEHSVILTTDNHSVNITMDGFNPVGSSIKNPSIISRELVKEALNNLEDVSIGAFKKKIRIKVAGRGNTEKLTTTVNATMRILKYAAPASLMVSASACYVFIL